MTKKNGHKPTPSGPTRAAIYRRTSTELQGTRVSPEAQLADCQAHATAHGYSVVAVYTDTERYRDARGRLVEPSGTRADRPGFQQMIADGQAGRFDVIVAWKEDRLYRGVKSAVVVDDMLEETGIAVELVKETFERRMLFIKASIGRLELENIRERTAMGHLGRVQRGMHHGGRLPRGYRAIKDGAGRTTGYEVDERWRPFFDDLARLFLARRTYQEIADELGINPATKRPWQVGSLHGLLTNPFYLGRIEYGRHVSDETADFAGVQPPAWDAATCAAIERELSRRSEAGPYAPRARTLFAGIARCGICGRALVTGFQVAMLKTGQARYRYYGCWRDVYIKQGLLAGPPHGPNFIGENKLLKRVKALFATLSESDVDDWLARNVVEGHAQPDPAREARLRDDLAQTDERLADLAVGLAGVRNSSPAATEAVIAELRRVGAGADRLREQLREVERAARTGPDLAAARSEMLAFVLEPGRFDLPYDELRVALARALATGIYVRGGALVGPVEPWA